MCKIALCIVCCVQSKMPLCFGWHNGIRRRIVRGKIVNFLLDTEKKKKIIFFIVLGLVYCTKVCDSNSIFMLMYFFLTLLQHDLMLLCLIGLLLFFFYELEIKFLLVLFVIFFFDAFVFCLFL